MYFHFVRSFVVSLFVILSERLLLCTHFIVVEMFASFVIINCNIFVPLIVIVINLWLSKLSPHQIGVFQSNDIHKMIYEEKGKESIKQESMIYTLFIQTLMTFANEFNHNVSQSNTKICIIICKEFKYLDHKIIYFLALRNLNLELYNCMIGQSLWSSCTYLNLPNRMPKLLLN